MFLFPSTLILMKGGGDLGTGVAWRLHRAGFPVVIAELAQPLVVRRAVAFASAVYDGQITVEGVTAWRADTEEQARQLLNNGIIPVLVDPETHARHTLKPTVLIDAVVAKRNTGTRMSDAAFVLALGPGFVPGIDCHAAIETQRGHNLGRVIYAPHRPAANTGVPGEIAAKDTDRVLRASCDGVVTGVKRIGDSVDAGQVIARVGADEVRAPFAGVLRGLVHEGLRVQAGTKIGDVDPRGIREHCFTISDKALAVGGGALEGVLSWISAKRPSR